MIEAATPDLQEKHNLLIATTVQDLYQAVRTLRDCQDLDLNTIQDMVKDCFNDWNPHR